MAPTTKLAAVIKGVDISPVVLEQNLIRRESWIVYDLHHLIVTWVPLIGRPDGVVAAGEARDRFDHAWHVALECLLHTPEASAREDGLPKCNVSDEMPHTGQIQSQSMLQTHRLHAGRHFEAGIFVIPNSERSALKQDEEKSADLHRH